MDGMWTMTVASWTGDSAAVRNGRGADGSCRVRGKRPGVAAKPQVVDMRILRFGHSELWHDSACSSVSRKAWGPALVMMIQCYAVLTLCHSARWVCPWWQQKEPDTHL
jgi:hypothetical protein